ncbi:hypothetical protein AB0H24_08030 [Streptomyces globisporus]|uniref:hypothetical protein n=1 Tax=Streptomyces globisporus TaxID=1908 RepID=UPI003460B4AA
MGKKAAGFRELTSSGEQCIETLSRLALRVEHSAVSPEWIFIDAVTAVEVHVDRTIDTLVSTSGVSDSRFGRALLTKLGDDMNRSWPARYEWLSGGFGFNIRGQTFEQNFDVVIECRNAIVHGSGSLTSRQQSNFARFTELRRRLASVLKVDVHGVNLALSAESAKRSITVSRDFIYGFDLSVGDLKP